jgi:hypothetical protein
MMKSRLLLALLTPLALLLVSPPAQAAPVCIPEAPVCAGLDNGRYVFTIRPRPTTFSLSFTVNGSPATGSLSYGGSTSYLQGWFQPSPPLVSGDVICMRILASGVAPGPYCSTAP